MMELFVQTVCLMLVGWCRLGAQEGSTNLPAAMQQVRSMYYGQPGQPGFRTQGTPIPDRRYRTHLNKHLARVLMVSTANSIWTTFIPRLKKWCRAQVCTSFVATSP